MDERHEIYKAMLRQYRLSIGTEWQFGFCYLYRSLFYYQESDLSLEDVEKLSRIAFEDLVELQEFKPKEHFFTADGEETFNSRQFWFPIHDPSIRISILKKCIEKTKIK